MLEHRRYIIAEAASVALAQAIPATDRVVIGTSPRLDGAGFGFLLFIGIPKWHPVAVGDERGVKVLDATEPIAERRAPDSDHQRRRVSRLITPGVELRFTWRCREDPRVLDGAGSFDVISHGVVPFVALRPVGLLSSSSLCHTLHDTICHDLRTKRREQSDGEPELTVRAGRLLSLLMTLQNGGRYTAAQLANQLAVSERTVLRDIDVLSGSGVPVYGIRGPGGGFELLDTFEQKVPELPPGLRATDGKLRRVRVRLAPAALQLALVNGKPTGWRRRPNAEERSDRPDWIEGSFRFSSYEVAVSELTAFGADVEVLLPVELRQTMAAVGQRMVELYGVR